MARARFSRIFPHAATRSSIREAMRSLAGSFFPSAAVGSGRRVKVGQSWGV